LDCHLFWLNLIESIEGNNFIRLKMSSIRSHKDLKVYQSSFSSAVEIFNISISFPKEEKYSLTDQIKRSSRSVSANLAEAFRKRRYERAFVAKLTDAEGEAAETQVWLDFSLAHQYISQESHDQISAKYETIIHQILSMIIAPSNWSY
jgi:four helix bundle protein